MEAAALAGLAEPTLAAEPVAAALAYWQRDGLPAGGHVAIYDLGGGTFDTAVLQATVDGFRIVGHPGGDGSLGGELFDEMVVNLIGDKLDPAVWELVELGTEPSWQRLAAIIRTDARRAKETLSSYPYADVLLPLPSGPAEVRIARAEFELILAPYLDDSIALMRR